MLHERSNCSQSVSEDKQSIAHGRSRITIICISLGETAIRETKITQAEHYVDVFWSEQWAPGFICRDRFGKEENNSESGIYYQKYWWAGWLVNWLSLTKQEETNVNVLFLSPTVLYTPPCWYVNYFGWRYRALNVYSAWEQLAENSA